MAQIQSSDLGIFAKVIPDPSQIMGYAREQDIIIIYRESRKDQRFIVIIHWPVGNNDELLDILREFITWSVDLNRLSGGAEIVIPFLPVEKEPEFMNRLMILVLDILRLIQFMLE